MANPDRANAIAGMTNMTLGRAGSALALLKTLENSMLPGTCVAHAPSQADDTPTWDEMMGELRRFETAVKASSQDPTWMGAKRSQWQAFTQKVDNQHPAGYSTATLALEISIKAACQQPSWMSSQRAAWVKTCNDAGAKPFKWGDNNFVCSGLDGCEVLLAQVAASVPSSHLSSAFKAGDYKDYGSLFTAVKQFEQAIKASSQEKDWMSTKRSKWLAFCNDAKNHTPSGFATAVLALDLSVPAANNAPGWVGGERNIWVTRCRNAGATAFNWN